MWDQQSLRSACAYAQSDQSLCQSLEYSMIVKLLLEFLSLKGVCTGSSESTHVKMPHCWKSRALAQILEVAAAVVVSRGVGRTSPPLASEYSVDIFNLGLPGSGRRKLNISYGESRGIGRNCCCPSGGGRGDTLIFSHTYTYT